MKVALEAQIVKHEIKSLRSLDKGARLTLEYKAEDDALIDSINRLHKADQTIMVVLMDKAEAE